MALLHKKVIVLILPLLFLNAIRGDGDDNDSNDNPLGLPDFPDNPLFDLLNKRRHSLPDGSGDDFFRHNPLSDLLNPPLFGDGTNSSHDDEDNNNNNDNNNNDNNDDDVPAKPDFETSSLGKWELVNGNSGVSAMHVQLMPNNRIMLYDTFFYRVSRIKARLRECITYLDPKNVTQKDCWAHVVEYDIETNRVVRPIKVG